MIDEFIQMRLTDGRIDKREFAPVAKRTIKLSIHYIAKRREAMCCFLFAVLSLHCKKVLMIPFPDPLHPAVVHFPIALLIVGAGLATFAVIFRRWALPAAVILVLGAAGAIVAVQTGEREEHRLPEMTGEVHEAFENHEHAGKKVRNFSLVAALLALLSVLAARSRMLARLLAAATAVVALMTAYHVAQAGHYGGALVYEHGVGVGKNSAPKKQ